MRFSSASRRAAERISSASRSGVGDFGLVGLGVGLGLATSLLGGVEVVLDLLLTLLHHAENRGPSELGEDEPDDEEGDESRDELRRLREQDVRTARRFGEGDRRGGKVRQRNA